MFFALDVRTGALSYDGPFTPPSLKGSLIFPATTADGVEFDPSTDTYIVEDDPEGWTFWKIKQGIRWTGMPAWKDSLSDDQIWKITLFLKHMDKLPPAPQAAWQAVKLGEAAQGLSQGAPER